MQSLTGTTPPLIHQGSDTANRISIGSSVATTNMLTGDGSWLDVSKYRYCAVQLAGGTTPTIFPELSNDATNGVVPVCFDSTGVYVAGTGLGTGRIIFIPLGTHYMRLRMTSIVSGTVTATAEFGYGPMPLPVQAIAGAYNSQSNLFDAFSPGALLAGRATTANPAAQTDSKPKMLVSDKLGRLVVVHQHVRDLVAEAAEVTITNATTETTLLAAGGAGVFHDLTRLKIANAHTAVVLVELRDATAGTVIETYEVPPSDTRAFTFDPPKKQTTANNNWTVKTPTNVAGAVYFTAQAVKNL